MDKPYHYNGLEASLYDELDELSEFEDYHFYRWHVSSVPGPVLDIGCGTGRILLPMAKEGIDIDGIEYSPEMVELCRKKVSESGLKSKIFEMDMRTFSIDRKYATILIPGFTIQLLSDEDALMSLKRCKEYLLPGGQLIVSSFTPWEMIYDGRDESELYERKRYEDERGKLVAQASQSWVLNKSEETLILNNRYQRVDPGTLTVVEEQETSMKLRWRLPYDLVNLMENAGFESPELYGDFEFEECDPEAESLVCIGRF